MIYCDRASAYNYAKTHPGFDLALEFLVKTDFRSLKDGKYPISGDDLYASLSTNAPKMREAARLESHRKYIDLQCVVEGSEEIGWRSRADCGDIAVPYTSESDIMFYKGSPFVWLPLTPDNLAIFFPEDAHAPGVSNQPVRKVVMKIAVRS